MSYNRSDFLLTLAYLMGERSVNQTTSGPRGDFVQSALEDVYKSYPWRFARTNATVIVTGGVATLPTNYDDSHMIDVKYDTGSTAEELFPVDPDDEDMTENGSRAVWIEQVNDGEAYILKTKDTDVSSVRVRYQKKAPVLLADDSNSTPYPNKRTVCLGARRDVKLGQNPDADISQDNAVYERELAKDIAAHQVHAPRKKRRTAHDRTGSRTGGF